MTDSAEHGPDPATVEALGKISEALETVERARGHLYSFNQLSGSADLALQEGVAMLRAAGHDELAEEIDAGLVGRNVLPGRWTYQVVEEYDDRYWSVFREYENRARQSLARGRRHLYEARMKDDEQAGKTYDQNRPPR
ncbi:MAG TPA: hypothetical protein VNC79_06345 [Mycobacteriales bacterium]|nr:hypothetical protein [Mycobacteriales bacterium]